MRVSSELLEELKTGCGGGGGEGGGGAGGAALGGSGVSLEESFSTASLSRLFSNSLCLARRISFSSLISFISVSVCFNFVRRRASSI